MVHIPSHTTTCITNTPQLTSHAYKDTDIETCMQIVQQQVRTRAKTHKYKIRHHMPHAHMPTVVHQPAQIRDPSKHPYPFWISTSSWFTSVYYPLLYALWMFLIVFVTCGLAGLQNSDSTEGGLQRYAAMATASPSHFRSSLSCFCYPAPAESVSWLI